jgi:oligopeptide/dipeptide ABC transporter ATP-binding protein
MIAMAIACRPKLLVADEPTTALDVTIQSQIIDLLRELRDEIGMAVILISHDLGLVAEFAERVVVMYAGQIVEDAPAGRLFRAPVHPYAAGLLAAIPDPDRDLDRLYSIEGTVPDPAHRPAGCRFAPRCPFVEARCREAPPPMLRLDARHEVRCPVKAEEGRPRIVA